MKLHIKQLCAALLTLSLLSGCSSSENPPSTKAKSCAEQAIEVANDYLSGALSYDIASKKIDELSADMDYVNEDSDVETNPNHTTDFRISIAITGLSVDMISDNHGSNAETYDEIISDIEELEELCK